MEIGKFSKTTGISIDTLRYYDKMGLLVPQRHNNKRFYTESDIENAAVIKKLKALNFTLEEIKALFDLDGSIGESEELDPSNRAVVASCLEMIENKYGDILKREKELFQIKAVLAKMIDKTNRLLKSGGFSAEKKSMLEGEADMP